MSSVCHACRNRRRGEIALDRDLGVLPGQTMFSGGAGTGNRTPDLLITSEHRPGHELAQNQCPLVTTGIRSAPLAADPALSVMSCKWQLVATGGRWFPSGVSPPCRRHDGPRRPGDGTGCVAPVTRRPRLPVRQRAACGPSVRTRRRSSGGSWRQCQANLSREHHLDPVVAVVVALRGRVGAHRHFRRCRSPRAR